MTYTRAIGALALTFRLLLITAEATAQVAPAASEEEDLLDLSIEELMDLSVVSASKEEESIYETPVPVTVITRDMIERSGAKNLKDLLVLFVPGYTLAQDHNEVNVAVRGIYASSQQKVLILRDGHRLNSRAYSEANPDHSISLDSIQQIEVLRGPGSSLYGNVALTGVINLVTRKGRDLDGAIARAGFGSFDERVASLVAGKAFGEDHDLSLWASYYHSHGERVIVPPERDYAREPMGGHAILDGFRDPDSYDLGVKYRFGDFRLLGEARYSKYVEPFSAGGAPTGQTYEYNDYRTLFGIGPGLGSRFTHFGFGWRHDFEGDLEVDLLAYHDTNAIQVQLIIDPTQTRSGLGQWDERDLGAMVQIKKGYELLGKGSLLLGGQVDRMEVFDSEFPIQVGGEWTTFGDTSDNRLLALGSEAIFSGFAQLKHRFTDELILNMGGRYDLKDRFRGDNVENFSPRVALIYLPSEIFRVKASFAQSFVDAPYWYRYNSLASYRGGESLKPELLRSVQLTPSVILLDGRLRGTLNLFYNKLTDFIWRNNRALATEPIYQNAGFLESLGAEGELAWAEHIFVARANVTYQAALDAENYGITGGKIHNVPGFTGRLILDVNPIAPWEEQLWINISASFQSDQIAPITVAYAMGPDYSDNDNRVDAVLLLNAGVRWTPSQLPELTLEGRLYNLFDTEWFQGGSVEHPYPQPGRWWQLNASLAF